MGLIQNKVKVSQPNSHVVVKNAGGLRGLTGETGQPGPQGVPGQAATVTAGTTTTLPAGSNATVQNVGSTSAAIFNFGIPQGEKGDTGESGAAATISVGTTTTLEPGEDATVTNSGTSSAAVFNFGIPKGVKGDTGSQGVPGVDGFSPTATVSKTGDTATITITDKNGTTTAQISDGVTPTIDPELSPTSENPVQNKVVTNALAGKADKPIVVSSLPTTGTAGQEYFVDDRYNTVTELKGDTEQTTYSGKNKYNATKASSTTNTVTTSADIGQLYVNGTTSTDFGIEFGYTSLPAGTYTFCLELVSGSITSSSTGGLFNFRGDNITLVSCPISNSTKKNSVQVTVSANTTNARIQLWCRTTETFTNAVVKYQLVSGSTADYDFEPYVGGTASPNPDYPQEVQTVTGRQVVTISDGDSQSQECEINLGKNILPFTNQNFTKNNITFSVTDGTLYLNGTSTGEVLPGDQTWKTNFPFTLPAGTYTFSLNTVTMASYIKKKSDDSNIAVVNGTSLKKATFTITEQTEVYLGFYMYNMSFSNLATTYQLERGSTATTYASYFTPIELCKIGDYQDYIYSVNGDYYLHKEIGKKVLDGSIAPDMVNSQQTNTTLADWYNFVPEATGAEARGGFSNYMSFNDTVWSSDVEGFCYSITNEAFYFRLNKTIIGTTTSSVQTWLQSHPTNFYYIIKATDTQITDATLIAQLEALAGAKIMVDGGTATVTSEYLPATLTTAYNSNSGYIDYIYDGTNFVKVR